MTVADQFMSDKDMYGEGLRRWIFVRDLIITCAIGVHDYEKGGLQRVRINVQVEVMVEGRAHNDKIANVLSYETIVDGIRMMSAQGHINLVETLADRIVTLCLADTRAKCARVRVEKLDVYPDAAGVGVEIEREVGID